MISFFNKFYFQGILLPHYSNKVCISSASIDIPPFQIEIYLVKVLLNVNIVKQDLLNKTVFENFMKWGLKGGISVDTDSGPLGYIL